MLSKPRALYSTVGTGGRRRPRAVAAQCRGPSTAGSQDRCEHNSRGPNSTWERHHALLVASIKIQVPVILPVQLRREPVPSWIAGISRHTLVRLKVILERLHCLARLPPYLDIDRSPNCMAAMRCALLGPGIARAREPESRLALQSERPPAWTSGSLLDAIARILWQERLGPSDSARRCISRAGLTRPPRACDIGAPPPRARQPHSLRPPGPRSSGRPDGCGPPRAP